MKKHLSNILHCMGSVLDIFPRTDYDYFVPKGSDADRLRGDWDKVGKDLNSAIHRFANEHKDKKAGR